MLYVREFSFENYIMFTQLISLLLPCLKYCICSTFFIPPPSFVLMFIHTRTYWNVFLKHLHDSVLWFIFIYPSSLFICLFVWGRGYLLTLIYNIHFNLFGVLSRFWFQGPNCTKVCGLCLKPVQPSEIRDS